jgi:hypothetical protein
LAFTGGRAEEPDDRPPPRAVDPLFSDVPGDTAG